LSRVVRLRWFAYSCSLQERLQGCTAISNIQKACVQEQAIQYDTKSPFIKAMVTGFFPSLIAIRRNTFTSLLDSELDPFLTTISNVVANEKINAYGMPLPSVCHDMWTTLMNDKVLGSSLRFITKDFKLVQIACIMLKNNINPKSKTLCVAASMLGAFWNQ
jgi:hypothetical protein